VPEVGNESREGEQDSYCVGNRLWLQAYSTNNAGPMQFAERVRCWAYWGLGVIFRDWVPSCTAGTQLPCIEQWWLCVDIKHTYSFTPMTLREIGVCP
jgi:hypothetical protein